LLIAECRHSKRRKIEIAATCKEFLPAAIDDPGPRRYGLPPGMSFEARSRHFELMRLAHVKRSPAYFSFSIVGYGVIGVFHHDKTETPESSFPVEFHHDR
jgi:hypothetical protein